MDFDDLLLAALMNSSQSLKKRYARKDMPMINKFLLEYIKLAIQELDPGLDPQCEDFRTAVVLMTAAYIVGPRTDLLVAFTGYPLPYVAEISRRMRGNGRWTNDGVSTAHWFEGDRFTGVFGADCLVAEGLVRVDRTEDGEELLRPIPSQSESK